MIILKLSGGIEDNPAEIRSFFEYIGYKVLTVECNDNPDEAI